MQRREWQPGGRKPPNRHRQRSNPTSKETFKLSDDKRKRHCEESQYLRNCKVKKTQFKFHNNHSSNAKCYTDRNIYFVVEGSHEPRDRLTRCHTSKYCTDIAWTQKKWERKWLHHLLGIDSVPPALGDMPSWYKAWTGNTTECPKKCTNRTKS